MADERFDLGPRARADLPHHRALLADEDPLLGLCLDVDDGPEPPILDLVDLDGQGVRDLLAGEVRAPSRG